MRCDLGSVRNGCRSRGQSGVTLAMEITLCHALSLIEHMAYLRRITGKKDTFEGSACHERFERKPDASPSREFAAQVRSRHKPKSEDVIQAAFRVTRESAACTLPIAGCDVNDSSD